MSYDVADNQFTRLLTMHAEDRSAQGGLAVLPDEAPNTGPDITDAPLGTVGATPAGARWRKIAMTGATQWALVSPAPAVNLGSPVLLSLQAGAAPVLPTSYTATFAGSIALVWTGANGSSDLASLSVDIGGVAAYTFTSTALAGTAGSLVVDGFAADDVTGGPFAFTPGDVIDLTYAAGTGGSATSQVVWILLAPTSGV